jgi:hypothetical protein
MLPAPSTRSKLISLQALLCCLHDDRSSACSGSSTGAFDTDSNQLGSTTDAPLASPMKLSDFVDGTRPIDESGVRLGSFRTCVKTGTLRWALEGKQRAGPYTFSSQFRTTRSNKGESRLTLSTTLGHTQADPIRPWHRIETISSRELFWQVQI